jgi:predicted ATP-dependent Lon-type protease
LVRIGVPPLLLKTEGDGKMGSVCIYKVVIESSDGQETWQKDYIGPATSADDAVRRALSAFKKRADDRVVSVELVDQDSWVEDEAALPPDGEEWVPL